ncbi:MAG TPA: hypothetical protein VMZ04_07350 [Anaerolineae bacterium]|nr:hypothetical protein [Anaerolineae bacterium]
MAVTTKTKHEVTVTNTLVDMLRAEPERKFYISDIQDTLGSSRGAVKMLLSRLVSSKYNYPVKRVDRGFYQYDPTKEQDGLQGLLHSGDWKVENLVFVTKGVYPPLLFPAEDEQYCFENLQSNNSHRMPKAGYPWNLPSGQIVNWELCDNGSTQIISLSANGAQPFSLDHVLTLIEILTEKGLNDTWECVSMEVNIETRKFQINKSMSLAVTKGLFLKCYQHGPYGRFEIALRHRQSVAETKEIIELFTSFSRIYDSQQAIREVNQLRKEFKEVDGIAKRALAHNRQTSKKMDDLKSTSPKK